MWAAAMLMTPVLAPARTASAEPFLPVGVAKVDITPEYPVRMYGYASRRTESEGVAGRLKAGALAIGGDEGDGPAVLLTVDCGAVPTEIRAEVLRRVQTRVPLKPERFILANSHTHAGPNLKGMGGFEGEQLERIQRYARELTDWLEQVVLEALASRQPGQLARAQGSVGFAANRRVLKDGKWSGFGAVPDGAVDHSLPLLRVSDAEGNPIALVVNYACHNTTLRGNFMEIHGDWAGCAQESIEADHPGVTALVTIGCGADADPFPHGTVELCQQHGRALADEVNRLMAGPFQSIEPRFTARSAVLAVPHLEPPRPGDVPATVKSLEIAVWAFGDDLAMVFLPDEVVVDYALRMKREMDGDRLWINAYCNDVSAYIVSQRLIDEGGYEVRGSLSSRISNGQPEQVQPPMEDRIIEHVRTLLPESYRSSTR